MLVLTFAHVLIARIGHLGTHLVVLALYAVRFGGYALVPRVPWNLPFDLLQSVIFGLQLVAMTSQIALLAPPAVQPSAQGLAAGVYFGLGSAAGQLLGGFVYQFAGPRILFAMLACVVVAMLLVYGALHLLCRLYVCATRTSRS